MEIKLRTPCRCHNGHFAYFYYTVKFGEISDTRWDKTCDCSTDGIGKGFSPVGPDQLYRTV